MADDPAHSTVDRIDRALARIEAASRKLAASRADLDKRNRALRVTMTDAIATLDILIGQSRIGDHIESKAD